MADNSPPQSRSTNFISSWLRRLCCSVLQAGEIPRHVAIIMDGNRRFAKKMKQERAFGHILGFEKLLETLEWCLDLGITEVTVYAFSVYNFQRSKDEVDGLMELAKQKISRLLEERELINRYGLCIRVFGDITLLSRDVQVAVAQVVQSTKHNNNVFLNVCFAYASRYEITEAIQKLVEGCREGRIYPSDVSEELLESCLYISEIPDLVIRTSGEVRLSDFLMWQNSYSCLSFHDVLWPEFSVWNLFSAVLTYQQNYNAIKESRQYMYWERVTNQYKSDRECVLKQLPDDHKLTSSQIEELVTDYATERQKRIDSFVNYVRTQRQMYLEELYPL